MTPDELPASLAKHLDVAFEPLVLTYQQSVYGFALRLTGSPQDAEEIAQDAFVRAYHALGSYPPERICALALRPWLLQITLNVFRNRVRVRRVAQTSLDAPVAAAAWEVPDRNAGPEDAWLHREGRAELSAQIARLPERLRVPLVLRHVEGLPYGEIARMLREPAGTVKSHVHRGAAALRKMLVAELREVSDYDGSNGSPRAGDRPAARRVTARPAC